MKIGIRQSCGRQVRPLKFRTGKSCRSQVRLAKIRSLQIYSKRTLSVIKISEISTPEIWLVDAAFYAPIVPRRGALSKDRQLLGIRYNLPLNPTHNHAPVATGLQT